MRFAQLRKYDTANGPGIRSSVFFTGCTHNCIGCFNALYQDFEFGDIWTDETTNQIIDYLNDSKIRGLTLLGGEPLQQPFDEVYEVLYKIRNSIPKEKTIWVYSGYRWEEIISDEKRLKIISLCDVLIDGRFEHKLKNLKLKFRGSENQKIINIKKSLEAKKIILELE